MYNKTTEDWCDELNETFNNSGANTGIMSKEALYEEYGKDNLKKMFKDTSKEIISTPTYIFEGSKSPKLTIMRENFLHMYQTAEKLQEQALEQAKLSAMVSELYSYAIRTAAFPKNKNAFDSVAEWSFNSGLAKGFAVAIESHEELSAAVKPHIIICKKFPYYKMAPLELKPIIVGASLVFYLNKCTGTISELKLESCIEKIERNLTTTTAQMGIIAIDQALTRPSNGEFPHVIKMILAIHSDFIKNV